MSDIDSKIRAALNEDEKRMITELQEQAGFFDMLGMALRGKQAWITWYMWILGFIVFFLGVYFFFQFLDSEDLKTSLGWILGIHICISVTITIKVISFTQMQKLELMREIKRLELRLISSIGKE